MTRTQLYLPESQYRELKQLAALRKQTFAQLTREIIEEKLKEIQQKESLTKGKNKISAWLSSLKKIEKLKGGVMRDGSIKHDEYLYGKFMRNV